MNLSIFLWKCKFYCKTLTKQCNDIEIGNFQLIKFFYKSLAFEEVWNMFSIDDAF